MPQVVSTNPVHGEVYSIQHYVIKVFSWYYSFLHQFNMSTNISEILLRSGIKHHNLLNPLNTFILQTFHLPQKYRIRIMFWLYSSSNSSIRITFYALPLWTFLCSLFGGTHTQTSNQYTSTQSFVVTNKCCLSDFEI